MTGLEFVAVTGEHPERYIAVTLRDGLSYRLDRDATGWTATAVIDGRDHYLARAARRETAVAHAQTHADAVAALDGEDGDRR